MTRIFTDGGEMGDMLFWSSAPGNMGVDTTTPRSGTYSYWSSTNGEITKQISAISEFYLRFGWYGTANQTNYRMPNWKNGATVLGNLRPNGTSKKIEIYTSTDTLVSTGSFILQDNTWYLIEVHVKIADAPDGVIEVKVDGVLDATFTGDTKPGAQTTVDSITFQSWSNTMRLDDLAMNSTSGSSDNSWCGDGKIVAIWPNAVGDVTQLTASSGSNFQCVDDVPSNNDTDYVSGSVAGVYDLYNLASVSLPAGYTVGRIYVECRSREELAGGDSIQLGIKPSGGSESWSGSIVQITSYARGVGAEYATNPATSQPWSESDVNALQVGPKVV